MNNISSPPEATFDQSALRYALGLLAKREYSVLMLKQKLVNKHYNEQTISALLEYLQEKQFISDQRFAELFIRDALRKYRGANRIRSELAQKGINSALVSEQLDALNIDWQSIAHDLLSKKFTISYSKDDSESDYQQLNRYRNKLLQKLHYQGFDGSTCKRAVDDFLTGE
ncbi:MAG: regulatory protein RecX [Pseudomonadales bacterium]|nr:regulatory protein RecX [Pseudomonadales bacterium]